MAPSHGADWVASVEGALGTEVISVRTVRGGCVSEVYALETSSAGALVVKVDRSCSGTLADEHAMLRFLSEGTSLPVPRVLADWRDEACALDLLVTEFVPNGGVLGQPGERHAAELLAALHGVVPPSPKERAFGFDRSTRIGGLLQPNPWTESWIGFFAEHRLISMATRAHEAGRLPLRHIRRVEVLAGRLARWLTEPPAPSLVHGDVWSGNVLVSPEGGRVAAFVDPAVYYGHAEVELAFITLFGTFGDAFFECYSTKRPIDAGFFEERRHLYNLYPLLVHARLFGGGYVDSVAQTLSRFGA